MELLDKLNWRYAAKAMNGKKVAQEKIDNIIEAISLAPTSSGLQPFEVMVITNQEMKGNRIVTLISLHPPQKNILLRILSDFADPPSSEVIYEWSP